MISFLRLQVGFAQDSVVRHRQPDPGEPVPTFYELLDQQWEYLMHEYPEWATDVGYPGQNGRWTDLSFDAIERRKSDANDFIAALRLGNRKQYLDEEGKFDYDVATRGVHDNIEGFSFHDELLPITQISGVQQDVPYNLSTQPHETLQDYNDILSRMRGVPQLVSQVMALMNKGIEMHVVEPKITMRDVPDQITSLLTSDPKNSPIMKAFVKFPPAVAEQDRTKLTATALQLYKDSIAPAFKRLLDYVVKTYIPNCRESIGLSDLPDGSDWYAYKVQHHTTTNMKPNQIFDLGMKEVGRIRSEMDSLRQVIGFDGDLRKFFEYMRTDPKFFYKDSASLVNGYKEIAAKANAALPKLFGKLPKLNFEVVPVPAYSQKSQTTAYYNQGSLKSGRLGQYFVNTYDLSSRPKWEMQPLTLHESVPGHHLQISLAQEQEERPELLKNSDYTAFVEGWALYAESLGSDLGFYTDPYDRMGQLTYEMWRAIRLVLDVGIHFKGWTRQQALDFFAENSGKSKHDIEVEVDRYIVNPGQALAYKIGELQIKELREYARTTLGPQFDIRAFHDELLSAGALPLDILERRMKLWVMHESTKK
ncbi:MAG: DUF885 domain-containing protein [Bacteroidota bacterium]|nr:DUF885 domain-containing protein [Bacteroidota bacterium]